MQKASSVLLGTSVVVAIVLLLWQAGPRARPPAVPSAVASGSPSLSASALPRDAGVSLVAEILTDPAFDGLLGLRPGSYLADGGVPPALSADAPMQVKFGLVLVRYRGAQGAAPTARTKAEALRLARELAVLGRSDFQAAVERGDAGSAAQLGSMPRGVLEPAPNYVLFSLAAGEVSGPVDTPTGYWVVKSFGPVN